MIDTETLLAELTARIDALEETVEELRYAGPVTLREPTDYDEDYWDVYSDD